MKRSAVVIVLVVVLAGIGFYTMVKPEETPTQDGPVIMENINSDQIITQCTEAMGGETLTSLRNLRIVQDFPDHAGLQRAEIERPNKVRLGEQVVFDGERAALLTPLEIVPEEEWKDFEVDIGWYIPAFLEYPAEYTGTISTEEYEAYQLVVELPLGAVMTYFIDKETGLIQMIRADFTLYGEEHSPQREFSDYRLVDGIMFPHAFTYEGRTGVVPVSVENVEFNVDLEGRFVVPE